MATRLSSLLVKDGVVGLTTMEQALRRKDELGGRLGTNLLELGLIDVEVLQSYLSKVHELNPPPKRLDGVERAALRSLSVDDVVRCGVIPFAVNKDTLSVLVKSPLPTQALGSIIARAGRNLRQHIVPEFRFEQALSALYELPLSPRASALVARFPQTIARDGISGAFAKVSTGARHTGTGDTALGVGWSTEALTRFLAHADSRDEIFDALLGFIGNHLPRRYVLAVQHGMVRGFAARAENVDELPIREVSFEAAKCPPATEAGSGVRTYRAAPLELGLDAMYRGLKMPAADDVLCFAIYIGKSPAVLIVVDNFNRPLPGPVELVLFVAVSQAATSLRNMLRRDKLRRTAEHLAIPGPVVAPEARPAADEIDEGWSLPSLARDSAGDARLAARLKMPVHPTDAWLQPGEDELDLGESASRDAAAVSGEAAATDKTEVDPRGDEPTDVFTSAPDAGAGFESPSLPTPEAVAPPQPSPRLDHPPVLPEAPRTEPDVVQLSADTPEGTPAIEPPGGGGGPGRVLPPEAETRDLEAVDGAALASPFQRAEDVVSALLSDNPEVAVRARAELLLADDAVIEELIRRFPGPVDGSRVDTGSLSAAGPLISAVLELSSRAVPFLVRLSGEREQIKRYWALMCFRELRHPEALHAIAERLFDEDREVRQLATGLLEGYRDHPEFPTVVQEIRYSLTRGDASHRVGAAEALVRLEDRGALPLLIDGLEDESDAVATACAAALERMVFQTFGRDKKRWQKWFRRHGADKRGDWLLEGVAHKSFQIRSLAAEAISELPGAGLDFDPLGGRREQKRVRQALQRYLAQRGGLR
jgi:hypothetical protein